MINLKQAERLEDRIKFFAEVAGGEAEITSHINLAIEMLNDGVGRKHVITLLTDTKNGLCRKTMLNIQIGNRLLKDIKGMINGHGERK